MAANPCQDPRDPRRTANSSFCLHIEAPEKRAVYAPYGPFLNISNIIGPLNSISIFHFPEPNGQKLRAYKARGFKSQSPPPEKMPFAAPQISYTCIGGQVRTNASARAPSDRLQRSDFWNNSSQCCYPLLPYLAEKVLHHP